MTTNISRANPGDRVWSPGPFIKSPMTCAFRPILVFPPAHPGIAVRATQRARPKHRVETDDIADYWVEYDYIAYATFDPKLNPLAKREYLLQIYADFATENVKTYMREVAVVHLRFPTEEESIGYLDSVDLLRAMDDDALRFLSERIASGRREYDGALSVGEDES